LLDLSPSCIIVPLLLYVLPVHGCYDIVFLEDYLIVCVCTYV